MRFEMKILRRLTFGKSESPKQMVCPRGQINNADRQIDDIVYKLYDLTDEEIKIVEMGRLDAVFPMPLGIYF